jgi:hypothetical protein
MVAGSTPAQRLAENRIEAPDFYLAELLLGAFMAVALIALTHGRHRLPAIRRPEPGEPLLLEG